MSELRRAQRRFSWRTTPIVAAIVVAAALPIRGGESEATAVRETIHAYVAALATRDAAGACALITPPYWFATVDKLNRERASLSLPPLPRNSCQRGFRRLFWGTAPSSKAVSNVRLTDLRVDGRIASAHLTIGVASSGGSVPNAWFVEAPGGVWRLDCCASVQIDRVSSTTYRVTGGSMQPTLKVGQNVTSDRTSMRSQPPSLGDIVIFHPPVGAESAQAVCGAAAQGANRPQPCDVPIAAESDEVFIKRVVGLPGDRIAIVGGHVIRDGVREKDPYILPCLASDAAECTFARSIVVPPGDYYMLGDHRGGSDDSRFWGPVKRGWIIGVVTH